ncbi:MAG TPA: GNAT family N-acetyltransferase [Armatimonadota bacterium]|nr:GNAT family N-acetyltransferase [Armatimonadota bacterium]
MIVESIEFTPATPELKATIQHHWASNAGDHIALGDDCCSIVAIADGRLIGLISAKKRPLADPVAAMSEAWISIVEVHEDFRRQGIGEALVSLVIDWANENGIEQVGAWSESIRTEALLLWWKMGFTFARFEYKSGDRKCHGFTVAKRLR